MYELIKKYEGLHLNAYLCPAGIPTIGYGSTRINARPVKLGDTITKQDADRLLEQHIAREVLPHIQGLDLTPGQIEATTSLIYNIGAGAFNRSKLKTAIKNRDLLGICKEWDFGFSSGLKGLFKRRTEELYLFIKDV